MSEQEPLVSVIMPVYNGERFIAESIESVLNQTHRNLELIILNNGSTDRTGEILAGYVRRDARVRVLFHPEPLGHAGEAASNMATRHAKGVYIAKLDADDLAVPERLARQVAFLQVNPAIFLVGSYLEVINEKGQKIGVRTYPLTSKAIYREFYLRFPLGNPAIMYRQGVVPGDFYFLKEKIFTDDYYSLFVHLHNGLQFANIPEYLTRYRMHGKNTVFTDLSRKWAVNMRVKRAFVNEFGYTPSYRHRLIVGVQDKLIKYVPEKLLLMLLHLKPTK